MSRIEDFYKTYYKNVSPSTFNVTTSGNKIIIEGLDKKYPKNFKPKDVKQYPVNQDKFKKGGNIKSAKAEIGSVEDNKHEGYFMVKLVGDYGEVGEMDVQYTKPSKKFFYSNPDDKYFEYARIGHSEIIESYRGSGNYVKMIKKAVEKAVELGFKGIVSLYDGEYEDERSTAANISWLTMSDPVYARNNGLKITSSDKWENQYADYYVELAPNNSDMRFNNGGKTNNNMKEIKVGDSVIPYGYKFTLVISEGWKNVLGQNVWKGTSKNGNYQLAFVESDKDTIVKNNNSTYAEGGEILAEESFDIWEENEYGNNSPLSEYDRQLWIEGYLERKKTNIIDPHHFYRWEENKYGSESTLSDDNRVIWQKGFSYIDTYAEGGEAKKPYEVIANVIYKNGDNEEINLDILASNKKEASEKAFYRLSYGHHIRVGENVKKIDLEINQIDLFSEGGYVYGQKFEDKHGMLILQDRDKYDKDIWTARRYSGESKRNVGIVEVSESELSKMKRIYADGGEVYIDESVANNPMSNPQVGMGVITSADVGELFPMVYYVLSINKKSDGSISSLRVGFKDNSYSFGIGIDQFMIQYVPATKRQGKFDKRFFKDGGKTKTWKNKYNSRYDHPKDESHSLKDISKETGVSKKGLQKIYNKGIGAWKTNIGSVRLKKDFSKNKNTKKYPRKSRIGKEQWAMARVYSAVMGGKAAKVDAKELKMNKGGIPKHIDNQYGVMFNTDYERPRLEFFIFKNKNSELDGEHIGYSDSKMYLDDNKVLNLYDFTIFPKYDNEEARKEIIYFIKDKMKNYTGKTKLMINDTIQ